MMTFKLRNDVEIPAIGLGTYKLTGAEGEAAIYHAIKTGYRLLDTASYYENEVEVGKAIQAAIEDGLVKREELFVVTKVWPDEAGYDECLAAFERSRQRLGLDYVDLYLFHWPTGNRELDQETYRALNAIYESKLARSIGVSNFSPEQINYLEGTAPFVNQVKIYPGNVPTATVDFCKESGIQLMAYSPINRGAALDAGPITTIAENHNKTTAQVILRWHIQQGFIPIPKSGNLDRIASNFAVFDFELSPKEMEIISNYE